MSTFTLGTHNLHDEAGIPTMFADVVLFTEAIPHTIRGELGRQTLTQRARRAARHAVLRATGHAVIVCRQQPDLVVVLRRRLFKVTGRSYTKFVDGREKVTPNRGTFAVLAQDRATRRPRAFVAEHRINAWHVSQPDRGERKFRNAAWIKHTAGTMEIIGRLIDSGYEVDAGGDTNTPPFARAYPLRRMRERGASLDRLASSGRIGPAQYLGHKGSDHPRLRAQRGA